MGNLHEMQALVLGRNKLSGTIPLSLGNLTLLNYLYLYDNNLSGEIPSILASPTLIDAILSNNNLTGSIPKELVDISTGVLVFNLSGNALTGLLPLELGNLINVADLDVSHNRLSGSLPNSLGKCVVMEDLRLDGNFFEGEIPESLQSLRILLPQRTALIWVSSSSARNSGDNLCKTKITNMGSQCVVEKDIVGLKITVNNNAIRVVVKIL